MTQEPKDLARKMTLAGWVLACESLCRLGWKLASILLLCLALAMMDLLPRLSPLWHSAALAAILLALVLSALPLLRFRWPTRSARQRRLERDSGLAHRPLSQWDDRPALPAQDEVARGLWQSQRERLAAMIAQLRLKPPSAGLAEQDPIGLRALPLLLLAVGLAVGWRDWPARLDRAIDPSWSVAADATLLQLWITPPAYTGLAPILLDNDHRSGKLTIAAGSKLLAELQGAEHKANLFIDDRKFSFTRLDRLSQKLETVLTTGSSMTLKLGRHRLGSWEITLLQDQPPAVAFAADPLAQPGGMLAMALRAGDDYGVTALGLTLRRPNSPDDQIKLPANGEKQIALDTVLDLSVHPWSGLDVTITPFAEDAAGHHSESAPVALTLSERAFHHPIAQQVALVRRKLAHAPETKLSAIAALTVLAGQPASFNDDTGVFLQLMTARSRLLLDRGSGAVPSVLDMLWAAALRIEDGDVPDARQAVDQASKALSDALARGAGDAEITRLTENLNRAMENLLNSLARQVRNGKSGDEPRGKTITGEQLRGMLGEVDDLAHIGARDAAQQRLQALQHLLDQLKNGGMAGPNAKQWQEGMSKLQSLTEGEQKLLDHTVNRAERNQQDGAKEDSQSQSSLRDALEKLRQGLPDKGAAPALSDADRAMQGALQSLQQGRDKEAINQEQTALNRLREGARQMAESAELAGGEQGDGERGGKDPLGRQMPGGDSVDDGKVKVPTLSDIGKSREILDELRRRADDPTRQAGERDYLRRLLDKLY